MLDFFASATNGAIASASAIATSGAADLSAALPAALPHSASLSDLLGYLRDPEQLILRLLADYGTWMLAIVALMVLIESGVLFPVLPGDSLLFTLGLLHTKMDLPLWVTCLVLTAAAIFGSQIGYLLGHLFGATLFKDDARILKTQYLLQAREFFDKWGGVSIIMARFVPFVRTFVPLAAGMARYNYRSFFLWNAAGAIIWACGLTILGSLLGGVAFIRDNLEVIAILIVLISILPMLVEIARKLWQRRQAPRQ